MTLLSTLRKIERAQRAAARQHEREARRRHRELMGQERIAAQMEEKALAAYRVQCFQAHLELIQSMHKEASNPWDWNRIARTPQPAPSTAHADAARHRLVSFKPGVFDKLLSRAEKRRTALEAELQAAMVADQQQTAAAYEEWAWFHRVANAVIAGDLAAYSVVLDHLTPWDEAIEMGASFRYHSTDPGYLEVEVTVADESIVPESEPTLTKTGKGGQRKLAQGKRMAYYQDYVCSLMLRIGRETFAHLPVHAAIVHAQRLGLNTATGRDEMQTFVSVAFDRPKFQRLVFDRLDPSDAVESFVHHMKFKKTAGFAPVERLPTNIGFMDGQ